MGCGASKGVAPAPGPQETPSALSPLKSNQGAAATDVAALHKQRLEEEQQKKHQAHHEQQLQDMCIPGRIESTTAPQVAPPPLLKELSEAEELTLPQNHPASAAADAEFNYDKELRQGASPSAGRGLVLTNNQRQDAAQGTAVVGGLLSKHPDWLQGSNTNPSSTLDPQAGAVATGFTAGVTSANNPGPDAAIGGLQLPAPPPAAAGKASSLPPLVGRGVAGPTATNSSLPPLFPAACLPPMESQHKQQPAAERQSNIDDNTPGAGSTAGSHTGNASDGRLSNSSTVAGDTQPVTTQKQQESASSCSSKASSCSSSPRPPAAAAAAAAPTTRPQALPSTLDPADPWSSLQREYATVDSSPSPDNSMAGSPGAGAYHAAGEAVGRGNSTAAEGASLPPVASVGSGAAVGGVAQASRRTTANAANTADKELVVDSDDEGGECLMLDGTLGHHKQHQHQHQQEPDAGDKQLLQSSAAGVKSNRSSISASADGRISAQSSRHSIVPHVAKSGGWGVGSLAGAGTIMLGDEKPAARQPGSQATAGLDDVFGDDSDEAPILPRSIGATGVAAETSGLHSSHSRMRVGAVAAVVQDTLDVEDIEDDVDTLIESEMGRDGLPADLAAKLAQFEAMGADSDEDGAGSGAESDGPSIYALMNHKQGSWRAA